MKPIEIQVLVTELASKTLEDRKERNLTREELEILVEYYIANDPVINPLISDSNRLDLSYFSITDQDLRSFNFANFILKHCNFRKSRFDGTSLKTILAKANSEEIALKGLNLESADLSSQVIYSRAIGVTLDIPFNFRGMNLDKSNFSGADLTHANFDDASLKSVIFKNTNLTGASFINTDIQGANFEGAIFEPEQLALSENYSEAVFSDTALINAIDSAALDLKNPQNQKIKALKGIFANFQNKFKIILFNMKKSKKSSTISNEQIKKQQEVFVNTNINNEKRFTDQIKQNTEQNISK